MTRRCSAAAGLLLAGGVVLAAQPPATAPDQPTPLFRSRVDAIEIDVRVADARGRTVTDLDPSEIEIFEDGVRQSLIGFTHVSVARDEAPAGAARPAPVDVASNRLAGSSRVYVLLLDDLHVDNRHASLVMTGARRFVDGHLGPGDLASIVYSSGRADAAQDFTSDRTLLEAAIDKFVGRKLRPASVERMEQYNTMFRGRGRPRFEDLRDKQDVERAFNARAALATIESVSGVLGRVPGKRKAMILFSEGIDYDLSGLRSRGRVASTATASPDAIPISPATGAGEGEAIGRADVHSFASEVLFSLQTALGAAGRANVAVYTIDTAGGDNTDTLSDLGAPVEDPALGLTAQHTARERGDAQESLWMIAENTGGFATLAGSAFDDIFSRIVHENSDYYVVAYSPMNTARDGTYRDIKVKVKREGVRVLARRGYYAPRAATRAVSRFDAPGISPDTSALVMAPLPSAGLALDAQVVALRRDKKRADLVVTVQVDGRALVPNAGIAGTVNTLEIALMAIDSTGKIQAATGSAVPIELDAAATRILREAGYRAVSRVQVPPGRYQVRVAVRERAGGQRGAVHASVDVPDYYSGKVEMSGLLLASERTAMVPTSIDRETNDRMPLLPILQRRFSTGDELTATLEVYDSSRRADLDVTTTLVDAAGKELFRATSEVGPEDFKVLGGAYVYSVQVPLDRATEAAQLLVEARPASSGRKPVVRRVSLSVAQSSQGAESSRP